MAALSPGPPQPLCCSYSGSTAECDGISNGDTNRPNASDDLAGRRLDIALCHRPLPAQATKLHGVTRTLLHAGQRVREIADGPLDLRPGELLWIQDNPNWFPRIVAQLGALPPAQRPPVVVWFAEPLPPPRAAGLPRPRLHLREIAKIALRDARATDPYSNARRLRSMARAGLADLIVASTPARRAYLAEQGIEAPFVPLGYVPELHGGDLGLARDIDVLFLGELVPRRRKLIARLEARGIRVHTSGSWFDPACWGAERTRLLNRTRIYLNLSRHPGELPGLRLILGMASKALVVSEPIHQPGPYAPGQHYVECSLGDMPETIAHWLADEAARARVAAAGHRLATQTLTMERSVGRMLSLIGQAAWTARTAPARPPGGPTAP